MTKASKHQAEAEEFMKFMLGSYAQTQMARAGQMPVLKNSTSWLAQDPPVLRDVSQADRDGEAKTPTPKWTQIDAILTTQIAKAFQGEPVQQALTEAAQQIDPLLK